MTGGIVGISALIYTLNAFFAGFVMKADFKKRLLMDLLLVFSITEINLLLFTGINYLFNFKTNSVRLAWNCW